MVGTSFFLLSVNVRHVYISPYEFHPYSVFTLFCLSPVVLPNFILDPVASLFTFIC